MEKAMACSFFKKRLQHRCQGLIKTKIDNGIPCLVPKLIKVIKKDSETNTNSSFFTFNVL